MTTTAPALAAPPAPARANVAVRYAVASTTRLFRNVFFLAFTIAMPLVIYLIMSQLFGSETVGATSYSALLMVMYAAYGAVGASMNGGAMLQVERRTGWFRQLQLTALTPAGFVAGKLIAALLAVLPALAVVYVAGLLVGGVSASGALLVSALIVWLSMLPMVTLGVAIAVWLPLEAVQAALTIVMMVLALAGGMILPVQLFPDWLASIATWLPTYWSVTLGQWPLAGGAFPWQGVVVLAAWLAILGLIAAVGFRRAARTSKR